MKQGTITEFKPVDAIGRIQLDDGTLVKFGGSAARGWIPQVGIRVAIGALEPHPLGGVRARDLEPLGAGPARTEFDLAQDEASRTTRLDAAHARIAAVMRGHRPASLAKWRALAEDGLRASQLSDAIVGRALAAARVAHCLVPGDGASWIGGLPRMRPPWPMRGGMPLSFIAQLAAQDAPADLPITGDVAVFYDAENQPWDDDDAVVIAADASARELRGAAFPRQQVRPEPILTLPAGDSTLVDLTDEDYIIYQFVVGELDAAAPSRHQLGGHARVIQGAMEQELAPAGPWRLLAQIGSDDDVEMMWGDTGNLYVWIREDDLVDGRLDRVLIRLQSF